MARNIGDVGLKTFTAVVSSDKTPFEPKSVDRKELIRLASVGAAYERSVAGLTADDDAPRDSLVTRAKAHLSAAERALNPPGKPGRKISSEVLEAVKRHYPHKFNDFEAGKLSMKDRSAILNSCRVYVQHGAVGPVIQAE